MKLIGRCAVAEQGQSEHTSLNMKNANSHTSPKKIAQDKAKTLEQPTYLLFTPKGTKSNIRRSLSRFPREKLTAGYGLFYLGQAALVRVSMFEANFVERVHQR